MFEITLFVNEKVVASIMYIFVARVGNMTTFLNQHWSQDTAWNNILRNKHAMERLTFCLIDIWNHLIHHSYGVDNKLKWDHLLFNQSIEYIIEFFQVKVFCYEVKIIICIKTVCNSDWFGFLFGISSSWQYLVILFHLFEQSHVNLFKIYQKRVSALQKMFGIVPSGDTFETFATCNLMQKNIMRTFQRLVVNELLSLVAKNVSGNSPFAN